MHETPFGKIFIIMTDVETWYTESYPDGKSNWRFSTAILQGQTIYERKVNKGSNTNNFVACYFGNNAN